MSNLADLRFSRLGLIPTRKTPGKTPLGSRITATSTLRTSRCTSVRHFVRRFTAACRPKNLYLACADLVSVLQRDSVPEKSPLLRTRVCSLYSRLPEAFPIAGSAATLSVSVYGKEGYRSLREQRQNLRHAEALPNRGRGSGPEGSAPKPAVGRQSALMLANCSCCTAMVTRRRVTSGHRQGPHLEGEQARRRLAHAGGLLVGVG
jgi:hypothetical protein